MTDATDNRVTKHPFAVPGATVTDLDMRENNRTGVVSEVGNHNAWICWDNGRRTKVSLKRLRPPYYALHWSSDA